MDNQQSKGKQAMGENLLKQMRFEAEEIFRASLKAVDPYEAVNHFVRKDGNRLLLGANDRDAGEGCFVQKKR